MPAKRHIDFDTSYKKSHRILAIGNAKAPVLFREQALLTCNSIKLNIRKPYRN